MKKPREYNPTKIDLWREENEIKGLRKELFGVESYGWCGYILYLNEYF